MMRRGIQQHFRGSVGKCDICFVPYDRQKHVPVIVCKMHHTICKECLDIFHQRTTCPFCRQTVQTSRLSVNYYVRDLLPGDNPRANMRAEVAQQANLEQRSGRDRGMRARQNSQVARGARNNRENEELQIDNMDSINQRELQFVNLPLLEEQSEELSQEQEADIRQQMTWHKLSTFFIVILQLPFIVLDLSIAMFYPYSQCMDMSYGLGFMVLRPWLLFASLISLIILCCILTVNRLHKKGYLSFNKMVSYGSSIAEMAVAKVVIWGLIEMGLFVLGMMQNCTKGIIIYGLILIIMHITITFLYFCHKLRAFRS